LLQIIIEGYQALALLRFILSFYRFLKEWADKSTRRNLTLRGVDKNHGMVSFR